MIFVKIAQSTKPIALLFGENWPILATFHSTIKIRKNDFWWKLGKIPSLYIALAFGENWPILATFQSPFENIRLDFWVKYQVYSHFSHFSLYNPNQEDWPILATFHTIQIRKNEVEIGQNTKPIALLFGKNWPILATFHSTIQIRKNDFWWNFCQNTKPIALLFGENWPILATFHSTIQIRKNDVW